MFSYIIFTGLLSGCLADLGNNILAPSSQDMPVTQVDFISITVTLANCLDLRVRIIDHNRTRDELQVILQPLQPRFHRMMCAGVGNHPAERSTFSRDA